MKKLNIIKIGGNVIDNPDYVEPFLKEFAQIEGPKILIHGGGKLASTLAEKLGVKQVLIDGRRVTNIKTLKITTMVYGGLINKNLVAKLQALNCNAIGLCGADGNLIKSKKRENTEIDYGYVGDITTDCVNINLIHQFINMDLTLVICPISYDGKSGLLNTNADTIASVVAVSLSKLYDVNLTYCFEKNGVLFDTKDEDSFMKDLKKSEYSRLKTTGIISNGMIPKLDNAFDAIDNGVKNIIICHSKNITCKMFQIKGTQLINDGTN